MHVLDRFVGADLVVVMMLQLASQAAKLAEPLASKRSSEIRDPLLPKDGAAYLSSQTLHIVKSLSHFRYVPRASPRQSEALVISETFFISWRV